MPVFRVPPMRALPPVPRLKITPAVLTGTADQGWWFLDYGDDPELDLMNKRWMIVHRADGWWGIVSPWENAATHADHLDGTLIELIIAKRAIEILRAQVAH